MNSGQNQIGLHRIDELIRSYDITAKCRYHAAERLKRKNKLAFLTLLISSLLLIILPLLQLADTRFILNDKLVGSLQIFIAVISLVYSAIIYRSEYDVRAVKHIQVADKCKDYSRRLKLIKTGESTEKQIEIEKKYNKVTTYSENHERIDYYKARLELNHLYDNMSVNFWGKGETWLRYYCNIGLIPAVFVILQITFFFITVDWFSIGRT